MFYLTDETIQVKWSIYKNQHQWFSSDTTPRSRSRIPGLRTTLTLCYNTYIPWSMRVDGNLVAETLIPSVWRVFSELVRGVWRWFSILECFW